MKIRHSRITAISTKYLQATGRHGARIQVDAGMGRVQRFQYDYAADDPHHAALECFLINMGWEEYSEWICGGGEQGNFYVCISK